jgi:hypothetical protein
MICLIYIQIIIKHVNRVSGQQEDAGISAFRYHCSPQTGVEIHAYLLHNGVLAKSVETGLPKNIGSEIAACANSDDSPIITAAD